MREASSWNILANSCRADLRDYELQLYGTSKAEFKYEYSYGTSTRTIRRSRGMTGLSKFVSHEAMLA